MFILVISQNRVQKCTKEMKSTPKSNKNCSFMLNIVEFICLLIFIVKCGIKAVSTSYPFQPTKPNKFLVGFKMTDSQSYDRNRTCLLIKSFKSSAIVLNYFTKFHSTLAEFIQFDLLFMFVLIVSI